MNYQEVLDYLYDVLPMYQRIGQAAYKADLFNAYKLDEYFKHPHKNFISIHVGGTNGKGSVSHMLASVLQEAGYKTGLYTSPHLIDFRERIKINGNLIDKVFIIDFIERNLSFFNILKPSFFEISVFMAFEYFRKSSVEIAVIEVGLGGRLDTTNIIDPVLSVITNIGHDHFQLLGNTLQQIAGEKAGIIKEGKPVVIGEYQEELADVFIEKAKSLNAPILFASGDFIVKKMDKLNSGQIIELKKKADHSVLKYELDLMGDYQADNLITVIRAMEILKEEGINITDVQKHKGLKNTIANTGLRGRWQVIRKNPLVICDAAHNREGIIKVCEQLKKIPYKKLHLILGFVNDKNVKELLQFFPGDAMYYYSEPQVRRRFDKNELANAGKQVGREGIYYHSAGYSFKEALKYSSPEDLIFIGGSSFMVADFLMEIENEKL